MAHLQYLEDDPALDSNAILAGIVIARSLSELQDHREVVARAAELTAQHVGVPVAGWLRAGHDTAELLVVVANGRERLELRRRVAARVGWSPELQEELRRGFASVIGSDPSDVEMFGDQEVLILVAGLEPRDRQTVAAVASLAADTVARLRGADEPDHRQPSFDEGLTWLAHELRGPLLAARAAIESSIDEEPRSERADILRRVRAEIDASAQMIMPMLKLAAGSPPEPQPVDVVRLVRSIVRSLSFEAGRRRVNVSAPRQLIVDIDPQVLRPAIMNVIRNALAYSAPPTRVVVRVAADDATLEIRVRDRGAGVASVERDDIFDRFVRGSAGEGREGSGLGLFIARRMIEAHGGTVDVESQERVGTTFTLRVPTAALPARSLLPA